MTKKLFHQVHTISPPCIFQSVVIKTLTNHINGCIPQVLSERNSTSVYCHPHNCSKYIRDPNAPSHSAAANRATSFVRIVLHNLSGLHLLRVGVDGKELTTNSTRMPSASGNIPPLTIAPTRASHSFAHSWSVSSLQLHFNRSSTIIDTS
jgi:hypothetical protein